jgi:carbon-monoxide dehydrogenase medium subunit
MSLPDFDLELPGTLDEALALLGRGGPPPLVMAGGTDVLVLAKQGVLKPAVVVSLSRLHEIRGIRRDGAVLAIGGGTSIAALESSPLLLEEATALVDAARTMATVQIRNRATVAGNLATAAACADLAPPLVALGASVRLRSASAERVVPLAGFFRGARATVLEPAELITTIEVPARAAGSGSAFVKFGYRRGAQIAVASAAAWVVLTEGIVRDVRIVLGAVAPVPLDVRGAAALLGQRPEGAALEAACRAAAAECLPISDLRGSAQYRRAVVAVVTRQAVELASRRAAGSSPDLGGAS